MVSRHMGMSISMAVANIALDVASEALLVIPGLYKLNCLVLSRVYSRYLGMCFTN
jgi:hypothetical protein